MKSFGVSVCIPVYNEIGALRTTVLDIIEVLKSSDFKFEIIVVDDGSIDSSISTISDLDVRIIKHKGNFGGGIARLTALRAAKHEFIIQTDADGTYPAGHIPEIVEALARGADLVVGARLRESAVDFRFLRVAIKTSINLLASVLSGVRIPDLNSGFRGYKRSHALNFAYMYPAGHSIMSTMTLSMIRAKLRVEFIPITYKKRIGKSSFKPVRDTANYLLTILRSTLFFEPLKVFLPIVLCLMFLGFILGLRSFLLTGGIGVFSSLLLSTSIIILCTSFLAEQLSTIAKNISWERRDAFWEETYIDKDF